MNRKKNNDAKLLDLEGSVAALEDECGWTEYGSHNPLIGESVKANPNKRIGGNRQVIARLLTKIWKNGTGRRAKGAFWQIGFTIVHMARFFQDWDQEDFPQRG